MVGIHVRRTDKISEGKYHSLDEYMTYAEDFYNKIDLKNERNGIKTKTNRTIYLATDEINVWEKEVVPWVAKGYQFIGNTSHTISAAIRFYRNSNESINALMIDLFMLSECDLIVCTLSSTFGRVAVNLQHSRDLTLKYESVDTAFFTVGQLYHKLRAILNNQPQAKNELKFKHGDIIAIDYFNDREGQEISHFKGGFRFAKIMHRKEWKKLPSYKFEDYIETYSFKIFE